ncbi:Gfo/Idh/MocA family protein [Pacificibacter marinus]|uniref:1,5-anhydro-D-fructose reductase n=1 Tax=Pacificibacter marinus TaxID=658057 RepID=A0A1Y5SJQ3_9RHOB|nr:Gfo/Idh/MocA family oxidoreductase [Pacificibacter marinus]SEK61121.1 Predicted dehydrogenase [Pacificibacter marinus]SLN41731.1 1,5-anhydro-D-fructose reductase [Pacificibacter marinus]
MSKPIRWGVLGAANFAKQHMARAIHAAEGAQLVALATSDPAKAVGFQAFCPELEVETDYDALLARDDIDAIYAPLPNHIHVEWTLKAMRAGKHVLTEKPIAMTASQVDDLIALRDETGLLCAEAYMIVHHPQWARAKQLLSDGAIGDVIHVETVFSYSNSDMDNIRNRPETGGGSIRDIGVYTYGAARWATGQEPREITHTNIRYENEVDVTAEINAQFDTFSYHALTSMRMCPAQSIRFHGTTGVLTVETPFNANLFGPTRLHVADMSNNEVVEHFSGANHYVNQVQNFCTTVRAGQGAHKDYPWTLENARGTQDMIDRIFAADKR